MKIEINGKALIAVALLSTGVVLADYVSIINVKDSGGINVTGGVTESDLNAAIQTAIDAAKVELKADYETQIAALETQIQENASNMTKLWSGSVGHLETATLSDSLENYDTIIVSSRVRVSSGAPHMFSTTFPVSSLTLNDRTELTYTEVSGHSLSIWFDYMSNTTIRGYVTTGGGSWNSGEIISIYGMKY